MLRRDDHEGILVLRLDRPEKLNAWDQELRDALAAALAEADGDPAVGGVVLTGTGERAFCAGADLTDPTVGTAAAAAGRMAGYRALYDALLDFAKPLVTALNGLAAGSAFQAILLTDHRVGHPGVRLGMPEINAGMPCITGSTILTQTVGAAAARSLVTTARFLGAERAMALGLIDDLVEPAAVLDRAVAVARDGAGKSPRAYAETRRWFREMLRPALDQAFEHAAAVRSHASMGESIEAGVQGFLDRSRRSR